MRCGKVGETERLSFTMLPFYFKVGDDNLVVSEYLCKTCVTFVEERVKEIHQRIERIPHVVNV